MAAEDDGVDEQKLLFYRKETTVSALYLQAWNSFAKEKKIPIGFDKYLITFLETDDEILIYFTKPTTKKVLGGGNGVAKINKNTLEVISFELSR